MRSNAFAAKYAQADPARLLRTAGCTLASRRTRQATWIASSIWAPARQDPSTAPGMPANAYTQGLDSLAKIYGVRERGLR